MQYIRVTYLFKVHPCLAVIQHIYIKVINMYLYVKFKLHTMVVGVLDYSNIENP